MHSHSIAPPPPVSAARELRRSGRRRLAAFAVISAVAATAIVSVPAASTAATNDTFLTDLTPVSQTNGWGPAKADTSLDGNTLTLAGQTYTKGWGTNAPSSFVYDLNGQFQSFVSDVGIDDEVGSNGLVQFAVYGDGKELWRSSQMTGASATETVDVDVSGVSTLKLVADDLGSLAYDHADWAGAKLVSTGNPIIGFYQDNDGSNTPLETTAAVRYGSSESDALATLPTQGYSLFRDGTYFAFRATWAFVDGYDGSTPGDKAVKATIASTSAGGTVMASQTGTITVLPATDLPTPWSDLAIGDSTGGDATFSDGTFTVAGGGNDIWGSASGFHYAFQRWTGDAQITARVDSVQDTDVWAKAGVMVSDGLGADATFAALVLTPSGQVGLERRESVGGGTDYAGGTSSAGSLPVWLKLSRAADTFTAFRSSDGENWVEVGSTTVPMRTSVYVGLAVTSHNTSRVNTSTFSHVDLVAAETDASELLRVAAQAGALLDQTSVGSAAGEVSQQAHDALADAIARGIQIAQTAGVQQQQIDAAAKNLLSAINAFQAATVQSDARPFIPNDDLNGSGTSSVGDLGIASGLGGPSGDGSRLADVNNDGVIDGKDYVDIADDIVTKSATAATPPMGWNSWDVFANTVNEKQLREHTDYVAAHLKQYGWQYIVNDIQWYNPQANGSYDMQAPAMDQYGRLIPAVNRFPSSADGVGFKDIADYVHSKGLKYGIHIMRGIPRAAVDAKLPIKGTSYTADQIATVGSGAWWNGDMWGIDASKPGAQEYVNSLLDMYADWGVDFIKIDDLSAPTYHQSEVELYRNAIDQTGRQIVLSTSPGNTPIAAGPHVETHANMWRMSNDFWDNWNAMREMYDLTAQWTPYRGPGHWPDADMIPFGKLEIRTDPSTGQERGGRSTNFTRDEQTSLMTLWSIAKSPLILGNDLRVLGDDPWTTGLITNRAVLHVNQASTDNKLLYRDGDVLAWTAKAGDGSTYLSNANLTSKDTVMTTSLDQLGLSENATYLVYDLWSDSYLGTVTGDQNVIASVPTHGARLLQLIDASNAASFTTHPVTSTPFASEPATGPVAGGPSLTLNGIGKVEAGSQVTVTVGASALAADTTAHDITVSYDPDALQIGAVTAAGAEVTIVAVDPSTPGKVRILLSTPNGVDSDEALAKVAFTVIGGSAPITATGTVANASGTELIANPATSVAWTDVEPTPTPTEATPSPTPTEATPTPTPTPTGSTSAPSGSTGPAATFSQTVVERDGVVQVTVTGLRPGEQVWANLDASMRIGGIPIADANGRVTFAVRVPGDIALGDHRITVTRADGSVIAEQHITVVAKGTLAATGAQPPLGAGLLAAGLLVAGGLLWVMRRPRRTAV